MACELNELNVKTYMKKGSAKFSYIRIFKFILFLFRLYDMSSGSVSQAEYGNRSVINYT